jgi:hypothetical protein
LDASFEPAIKVTKSSSTSKNLRLQNEIFAVESRGNVESLFWSGCDGRKRDRDAILFEKLLALVFVKAEPTSLLWDRSGNI